MANVTTPGIQFDGLDARLNGDLIVAENITTSNGDIEIQNSGIPKLIIDDTGNGGGGGAEGVILFKNNSGNAIGLGYTNDNTSSSDLIISTDAASTYGGYLNLDAAGIQDATADIILDPKSKVLVTKDLTIDGGDLTITKQNDAPTMTLLHDGTNPSTDDLLFKMQFQSDYDGSHQNWGKIELSTNASAVRTEMDFYVKSTSGNEELGLRIEGGSTKPKTYIYGDLIVEGDTTTLNTLTVEVEDNIIQLNTTQGSPDTATATTSGISIYRGNGVTQASFIFDDADDVWDLTNTLKVAGSTESTRYIATNGNMFQLHVDSWNSGQTDHYVLYNGWTANTGDYVFLKSSGNQNGSNGAILISDGNSGGRVYFGLHGNQQSAVDSATDPLATTYAYIGGSGNYFREDTTFAGTIASGQITITTAAVPLILNESGHTGDGQWWRMPLDGGNLRFDVSVTGNSNFTTYYAPLQLNSNGTVDLRHQLSTKLSTHTEGIRIFGRLGLNMDPGTTYQFATQYNQTNPDDDFRFAHYIDANFSGADNTTGDREQGGIYLDLDSSADGDGSNEHRYYGIYIDQKFTGFSDQAYGLFARVETNNITEKTGLIRAVYGHAVADNSNVNGGVSSMASGHFDSYIEDMGDVDTTYGSFNRAYINSTRTTNVDTTVGVHGEVEINSPNAISYSSMYAFRAQIDNNEGSVPTFGNQYLYYGEYLGDKGSNAYGLYLTNEDKNYISGDVGIGETSPLGKLHIKGSDTGATPSAQGNSLVLEDSENGLSILSSTAGAGYINFGDSGDNNIGMIIYDHSSNSMRTWVNAAERMQINSSGNVGIGQTSIPTNTRLNITGTNNYTLSSSSGMGGIKISGTTAGQGNYTSGIGFAFGSGTSGISGVQGTADSDTMGLAFFTHPSGTGSAAAEEKMRIDYLGNVGIGITGPSYKLQINSGVDGISAGIAGSTYGIRFDNGGTFSSGMSTIHGVDDTLIGSYQPIMINGSDVRFGTSATERMRIHSDGQVEFKKGAAQIKITDTDDSKFAEISYSSSFLSLRNNTTSSTHFVLNESGNVGIGTTGPVVKLQVNGSGYFQGGTAWNGGGIEGNKTDIALVIDEGDTIYTRDGNAYLRKLIGKTTGDIIQIGEAGTSLIDGISFYSGSSCAYTWHNNSSAVMKLTATGLGIGTTAPAYKLDVDTTFNDGIYLRCSGTGDAEWLFSSSGTNNFYIKDINQNLERLRINTSGYLGVLQSNPQYELDVDGDIHASGDVIAFSDISLKENIKTIDNSLEKVNKLRGVEFNKIGSDKKSIGVIAQEIEKVLPEVVKENDKGIKSVAYGNITGILIEAIKELKQEIETLKTQINN